MAAPIEYSRCFASGKLLYFCFVLEVFISITCISVAGGDSTISEDFEVKPGGQLWTTVKELGPCKCTFQYAAQGGTNEKWLFELSNSDDGTTFSCDIKRPSGISYLFFQSFKASIKLKGAHLKSVELFADTDNFLKPQEFVTTKGKIEVTHNEGLFKSKLSRLLLIAEKPRTDL